MEFPEDALGMVSGRSLRLFGTVLCPLYGEGEPTMACSYFLEYIPCSNAEGREPTFVDK
jgi:hypothetical protein